MCTRDFDYPVPCWLLRRIAGTAAVTVCLLAMSLPLAAQSAFERLSKGAGHEFYIFTGPLISDSVRFVAFHAIPLDASGQLVDGPNLWLKDRTTAAVQAVGIGSLGGLSADGEFLAFTDPTHTRVFVYQRSNHATSEIQVPLLQPGAFVTGVVISGDGRYVAFSATTSGEGAVDHGVFLHDRVLGRTEVLIDAAPIPAGARGLGFVSDISHDGRFIVFTSHQDLVAPDAAEDSSGEGADADVFVVERGTLRIERISVPTTGPEAVGSSWLGRISGDGRYVAFLSEAANLVPGDPTPGYGSADVFLRDRVARVTTRVSPDRSAAPWSFSLKPSSTVGRPTCSSMMWPPGASPSAFASMRIATRTTTSAPC